MGVCPSCGEKTFKVEMFRYELPVEGPVILFVGRCERCGARTSDTIPLATSGEREATYEVPHDLHRIVYLPPNTEVSVPELGIEMRLTRAFMGRITTVEGILRMMQDDVKDKKVSEMIEDAIAGKRRVRVFLRNEDGMIREIRPRV